MPRKTKQNSLTSPELLEKVHPKNRRLKKDFLSYLKTTQRSPNTIAGYSNDLDIFFVWNLLCNDDKFFPKITKRNYAAFQLWLLQDNGNSPARIRRVKATISSLSNFVENVLDDEEEFKGFRSVIRKIEDPVLRPVREKTVWEEGELEALLDQLSSSGQHEKACVVALAMYSGRRKAELCRFRVSDFYDSRLICGGALYKSAPIQTKGRGGGKYIPCYTLAKKFKPYLNAWLKQRKELKIQSDWLFPSKCNLRNQISPTTLNSWAKTFEKMTGKPFYFHALRHFWTSYMSKLGLPDGVIQSLIGWESADMVRVYKDISVDEEIGRFFDENGEIKKKKKKSVADL